MRRITPVLIILVLMAEGSAMAAETYWYLAASISRPGREIVANYNQKSAHGRVLLIIGGSGQLLSKLGISRKGGLYTPASTGFLEKARKKGLVRHHTPLLYQTPVFALSTEGRTRIRSFEDLQKSGMRLGLGNPKTMALGASYLKIEKKMGSRIAGRIRKNARISGINILQIVNYLKTGVIDAGTVFESVAQAHQLDFVEIPRQYNIRNVSHLIRLSLPVEDEAAVSRFEKYILQQSGIFQHYGFRLAR